MNSPSPPVVGFAYVESVEMHVFPLFRIIVISYRMHEIGETPTIIDAICAGRTDVLLRLLDSDTTSNAPIPVPDPFP